jgi:hypothetical protein
LLKKETKQLTKLGQALREVKRSTGSSVSVSNIIQQIGTASLPQKTLALQSADVNMLLPKKVANASQSVLAANRTAASQKLEAEKNQSSKSQQLVQNASSSKQQPISQNEKQRKSAIKVAANKGIAKKTVQLKKVSLNQTKSRG